MSTAAESMPFASEADLANARVLHVLPGLATGGTETMLLKLLTAHSAIRASSSVLSLGERGEIGERIEALGVPVYTLGMRGPRDTLGLLRLTGLVRTLRPTLVQGWLAHGNLAALFAGAVRGTRSPVLWNVRDSLGDLRDRGEMKRTTAAAVRICARLSRWPRVVIYNSHRGMTDHLRLGYPAEKAIVIPNGFETDRFRPDAAARRSVRAELGIPQDVPLIGMLARYHPKKDHRTFLQAAARVLEAVPEAHFVLAGRNVDASNRQLGAVAQEAGVGARLRLLGLRSDVARLATALDLLVSSSSGQEGLSNAIGEAMSCGVPCVVTDVGDSAVLVGRTGRVVRPRDPAALAHAVLSLLALDRYALVRVGKMARDRIMRHFSIASIAERYAGLYSAQLQPPSSRC